MTDKLKEAEEACHRARIAAHKARTAIEACGTYSPDMRRYVHEAEDDLVQADRVLSERLLEIMKGTLGRQNAA